MTSLTYIPRRIYDLYRVHGWEAATRLLWWRLRTLAADRGLIHMTWEPWLDDLVRWEGDTFVDVGANTGQWALALAGGYRRVIAVEPEPGNAARLRRRSPGNVRVLQTALWSHSAIRPLRIFEDRQLCSLVHAERDGVSQASKFALRGTTMLPVIPLDSLGLRGVDFVKIDVEGAEVQVLQGMRETLARCRPELVVELHSRQSLRWVPAFLEELGYTVTLCRHPYLRPDNPRYDSYAWVKAEHPAGGNHAPSSTA